VTVPGNVDAIESMMLGDQKLSAKKDSTDPDAIQRKSRLHD
jgi:hypothetical protein